MRSSFETPTVAEGPRDRRSLLNDNFFCRVNARMIFSARAYATMSVSVCLSVCLEVHWRILANLRFKFRSKFTAHCRRGEGSSQQQHLALC